MEELFTYLPLIAILCFGIFVQSAAGFAAGLLIVPAMLWCGYKLPEAQVSLLVATIPQNLWGVWSFKDQISVRQTVWPGAGRLAFLPLGIITLSSLEAFSPVTLRQVVGGFVLVATLGIMFFRPQPRENLHYGWGLLAFPVSGFLQGLVGMGGPAMVFWVQAHDWSTRQSRGFLFAMYLISIVPALGILYCVFPDRVVRPGLVTAAMIPLLLVATYGGLRLGTWLGRHRLRKVTLSLLLVVGAAGLAAPLIKPIGKIESELQPMSPENSNQPGTPDADR